jgi:hypothetical protein
MRCVGFLARTGEERKVYKVLVGNPKRKKPLGRWRSRWTHGIRMDLRETGWGTYVGFSWIRIRASGGLL